jgi:hypothetical protein
MERASVLPVTRSEPRKSAPEGLLEDGPGVRIAVSYQAVRNTWSYLRISSHA